MYTLYCSLPSAARGLSLPAPFHPCIATKGFCTPSATAEAETINCYCWLCSPHHLKVSPPHGLYKEIPVLLPLLSSPKADEESAGYSRAHLVPSLQEEPVRAIHSWCPSPGVEGRAEQEKPDISHTHSLTCLGVRFHLLTGNPPPCSTHQFCAAGCCWEVQRGCRDGDC